MTRAYDNNLGNSAIVTPANRVTNQYGAPNFGYLGAEANWKEVFDSRSGLKPDEGFQIWNLQFGIGNYELPDATGRRLALLGNIQYGIGGAQMSVDFDWKMGGQMSIAASFVRVSVAYSETNASPPLVRVFANMSSGSRAARSQVTRTFPRVRIAQAVEEPPTPAEVCIIPIPPMAHALYLFADDTSFYDADAVQVRFVGGVSNDYSSVTTDLECAVLDGVPFYTALANEDGVRFPEAARFVELSVPGTGTDAHLVTACFTLNL